MLPIKTLFLLTMLLVAATVSFAQKIVHGKIVDAGTNEPVAGATIHCTEAGCNCGCTTNALGEFVMKCMDCTKLSVSSIGYMPQQVSTSSSDYTISLQPATSFMQSLVVSANRGEATKRSEAPIAISTITAATLQEAKATTVDQVLNKISGVNMVNLGNEQHEMSIRQPMTTKSLFLYLEDGIPIRTTGLYNHNSLLEMNLAATKTIEVIKGPSSSLYGSEAIGGVVNFITATPTIVPVMKLSAQGNNIGYKRADLVSSFTKNKWGFVLDGYYADKKNSFLEFTDFHKGTITAKLDYTFSPKTKLTNSFTSLDYYSDMPAGVDSIMFATHSFQNPQTFTYRKVKGVRYHSTLNQEWNDKSKTSLTLLYRDNTIEQNPNYRIKDDYHKVGSTYAGNKQLAHGEINASSFRSYSLIGQHRQDFNWKRAVLSGGFSIDLSPSTYNANYIRIIKDTITRKYVSYQNTDSVLTNYATKLNNYAAFMEFEMSPVENMRVVASVRYDLFRYNFDNHLQPSAFTGSPDTVSSFSRVSPKIGFTYNFSSRTGVYANYSEGFVPPQVTELYNGVKVPNLDPSIFYNYEAGGWMEIITNKLSADLSVYRLVGTNEIISVKLDDGSYMNENAGRTLHRGIELGLNGKPAESVSIRFSGAYSNHLFVNYVEKGLKYNGNEMANAPHWMYNAEIVYKPSFAKGLRISAEWQHIGNYFADPQNTVSYKGYNVLNIRSGYKVSAIEVWINVMNATNNYYSYITTKSTSGYSYQLAEPVNINVGVAYDFGKVFK
jgi:iron complex outermembrane recepter protein